MQGNYLRSTLLHGLKGGRALACSISESCFFFLPYTQCTSPNLWMPGSRVIRSEKLKKLEVEGHLEYKLCQLYIIVQGPACNNCLEFQASHLLSASVMGTIGGSCCL